MSSGTGRIAVIGLGSIALFFAGSILFIAVTTRDDRVASPRPLAPGPTSTRPAGGSAPAAGWLTSVPGSSAPAALDNALPAAASGLEPGPLDGDGPPGSIAAPTGVAATSGVSGPQVLGGRRERLEAVNWRREKPPRSAEDLE